MSQVTNSTLIRICCPAPVPWPTGGPWARRAAPCARGPARTLRRSCGTSPKSWTTRSKCGTWENGKEMLHSMLNFDQWAWAWFQGTVAIPKLDLISPVFVFPSSGMENNPFAVNFCFAMIPKNVPINYQSHFHQLYLHAPSVPSGSVFLRAQARSCMECLASLPLL